MTTYYDYKGIFDIIRYECIDGLNKENKIIMHNDCEIKYIKYHATPGYYVSIYDDNYTPSVYVDYVLEIQNQVVFPCSKIFIININDDCDPKYIHVNHNNCVIDTSYSSLVDLKRNNEIELATHYGYFSIIKYENCIEM